MLVLSKGHASLALYSVMSMVGFFDYNQLKSSFCYPKSNFGGEPNKEELLGIEASTGVTWSRYFNRLRNGISQ